MGYFLRLMELNTKWIGRLDPYCREDFQHRPIEINRCGILPRLNLLQSGNYNSLKPIQGAFIGIGGDHTKETEAGSIEGWTRGPTEDIMHHRLGEAIQQAGAGHLICRGGL